MQDSKTWRTFASLLKGKPPAKEFGKVVEWSITAVLKTAVLRGTGGSNPSLSAIRILQDVDYQSCRIFFVPQKMPQKCTLYYAQSLGRFYKLVITLVSSMFLLGCFACLFWSFSPLRIGVDKKENLQKSKNKTLQANL